MNLYLIRHGETDWNKTSRLQGHTDIPLNNNGKTQVAHAADIIADVCPNVDVIISSPLSRACESAAIIADRLDYKNENIIIEQLLIERSFGKGEGLTALERNEKYPGNIFPNMESYEDLIHRARTVFLDITKQFADKQNVLIVAHGAILYAIVTAITDEKIAYGGKLLTFHPGSIFRLKYSDKKMEIAGYDADKNVFTEILY